VTTEEFLKFIERNTSTSFAEAVDTHPVDSSSPEWEWPEGAVWVWPWQRPLLCTVFGSTPMGGPV
jgi:hypothetical protein